MKSLAVKVNCSHCRLPFARRRLYTVSAELLRKRSLDTQDDVDSKGLCVRGAEIIRDRFIVVPMAQAMRDLGLLSAEPLGPHKKGYTSPPKRELPRDKTDVIVRSIDIPTGGLVVIHLASLLKVGWEEIRKHFAKQGISVKHNERLDAEMAVIVTKEFGVDAKIEAKARVEEVAGVTLLTSVDDGDAGVHDRLPEVDTAKDDKDVVVQVENTPEPPASSPSAKLGTEVRLNVARQRAKVVSIKRPVKKPDVVEDNAKSAPTAPPKSKKDKGEKSKGGRRGLSDTERELEEIKQGGKQRQA